MHATDDGDYPILAVNPVSRLYKLRRKNPEKARESRIPLDKVGAVWLELQRRRAEARTIDNRTAVDWACFILLTGTRLTESASLRWSSVDIEAKTFTLRGDVVKNHNGITLPMSTVLHEILSARKSPLPTDEKVLRRRRVQRANEYVFASYGEKTPHITSAPATFKAISKIAGLPISRHDLRRTFEDIATECKIDSDQRRLLINHITGDVHAVHYANNRRALAGAVEVIATWVLTQAKIADSANVVPLPAKLAG
jgi:integrase